MGAVPTYRSPYLPGLRRPSAEYTATARVPCSPEVRPIITKLRNVPVFRGLAPGIGREAIYYWLSTNDPQHVQSVIKGYVDSLPGVRIQEIVRASQSWPSYYREELGAEEQDVGAARTGLLSVLSQNVRALEELPPKEQRRFLRLAHGSADDADAATPETSNAPRAFLPFGVVAAAALAAIALGYAGERWLQTATGPSSSKSVARISTPTRVTSPHTHAISPYAHASRPFIVPTTSPPVVAARVLPASTMSPHAVPSVTPLRQHPRHATTPAPKVALTLPVRRFTAFRPAKVAVPALPVNVSPPPQPPGPTAESVIADLYSTLNPNADVRSVVIVEQSPAMLVADVTSREDYATVVDRLTLIPQGDTFEVVSAQRISAVPAHACFVQGVWQPC